MPSVLLGYRSNRAACKRGNSLLLSVACACQGFLFTNSRFVFCVLQIPQVPVMFPTSSDLTIFSSFPTIVFGVHILYVYVEVERHCVKSITLLTKRSGLTYKTNRWKMTWTCHLLKRWAIFLCSKTHLLNVSFHPICRGSFRFGHTFGGSTSTIYS